MGTVGGYHMRRYLGYIGLSLLVLSAWQIPAARADRAPQGRVSAVEGDLLVKGPDDSDWSYIERNAVVYEGDSVWADVDSMAELETEGPSWLRLGPDTRVDLRLLPPAGEVRLTRGEI